MAIKLLSENEVNNFMEQIQNEESEEKLQEHKDRIESGLFIFGASAIEDKLQDKLHDTIDTLKVAGIKFWVITGDK